MPSIWLSCRMFLDHLRKMCILLPSSVLRKPVRYSRSAARAGSLSLLICLAVLQAGEAWQAAVPKVSQSPTRLQRHVLPLIGGGVLRSPL